ncbi:HalOD1 output domain-containing protein [Haladaptatus salinisoli]|uniref:HalOD1 output domain-containing protein n=1 Tax=Haladaptatus salinisoli TaxID=2884876 RepID=UPI001D0AA94F|nr:HalOD1 output domain-containing protein [Haladaptatus salinisoli]
MTSTDDLSTKVIEKVAACEDVDPVELETPLYEVINPDALDTLFKTPSVVKFTYCGYTIVAEWPSSVQVHKESGEAESTTSQADESPVD